MVQWHLSSFLESLHGVCSAFQEPKRTKKKWAAPEIVRKECVEVISWSVHVRMQGRLFAAAQFATKKASGSSSWAVFWLDVMRNELLEASDLRKERASRLLTHGPWRFGMLEAPL